MSNPPENPDLRIDLEQVEVQDASQRLRRAYALILRAAARGEEGSGADPDQPESPAQKHPEHQTCRDFDRSYGNGGADGK